MKTIQLIYRLSKNGYFTFIWKSINPYRLWKYLHVYNFQWSFEFSMALSHFVCNLNKCNGGQFALYFPQNRTGVSEIFQVPLRGPV